MIRVPFTALGLQTQLHTILNGGSSGAADNVVPVTANARHLRGVSNWIENDRRGNVHSWNSDVRIWRRPTIQATSVEGGTWVRENKNSHRHHGEQRRTCVDLVHHRGLEYHHDN